MSALNAAAEALRCSAVKCCVCCPRCSGGDAAGVRRSDVMAEDAAVVMRDAEAGRVCWTTRANGRGSAALHHHSPIFLFTD